MATNSVCKDASVSKDIATIQYYGGYVYGGLYIGFLLFIVIAAIITDCVEAQQPNEAPIVTNTSSIKRGRCFSIIHRLKEIGKEIMRLRAIYFVIVVHIFDTLTDFLIMLEWYIKGESERTGIIDCNGINYMGCFYVSLIILLFYRILSAHYIYKYYQQSTLKAILSAIAQLLDISIFYEVYQSHIHSSQTDNLSYLSKLEKTFESSLQLILQMYVLMRELSQRDIDISYITIMSIVFSLVSLSTKVIADDALAFTKEANKKHKHPFLFRALFRICEIGQRLLAITLFAAFFGANFLIIILFIDLLTNILLFDYGLLDKDVLNIMSYLLCTMNLGLIPTSKNQLISASFTKQHPTFERFWSGLLMIMTRFQMITICKITTKNDHYLSYYLMRSKCIQSFFILFVITIFAVMDAKGVYRFDCVICTDFDDRESLYDGKKPYFLMFLIVGYLSCLVTYLTYSLSNVFYMKTGIILDRSPWVLFVNFNFFDSIRAYKERNGPNSFKIESTLSDIINKNARLPVLPRKDYDEDDIITTYPQLPFLISEINDNLQPLSVLYELLEKAILNLHDNFVDFFLNGYIVGNISHYEPMSYLNPITKHNLLEIAIEQQNNKIIQIVYLNCPKLLQHDEYRMFYDLLHAKYSATIDCIIDDDFDLITKCNPMTTKSIIFSCIDTKLYSILLLLFRRLDKDNFKNIVYKHFNVLFYAIKMNDTFVLDLCRQKAGLDWNDMILEVEYYDYHRDAQRYFVNPVAYAVVNGDVLTLESILETKINKQGIDLINTEMRCVFETQLKNKEEVMYLTPLAIAITLYPQTVSLQIIKVLLYYGADVGQYTADELISDNCDQEQHQTLLNLLQNSSADNLNISEILQESKARKEKTNVSTASLRVYVDKIIQTDNAKICQLLMNHFKMDPLRWKSANDTFILLCTRYDAVHLLQQLVENLDERAKSWIIDEDRNSRSSLSPFMEIKSISAGKLLFKLGFSLPSKKNDLRQKRQPNTSLLYTKCTSGAYAHRAEIVEWLIYRGARLADERVRDTDSLSYNRYTILANACNFKLDLCECLPILIPLSDLDRRFHKDQVSLLHLAVQRCHITTTRILLQNGFDIDIVNDDRQTPLMLLCGPQPDYIEDKPEYNRVNTMIHTLIHKLHANVHIVDKDGNNALHLAMKQTLHERVRILLASGIDVNVQNRKKETALHIACAAKDGHIPFRTQLIRKMLFIWNANCDFSKRDRNGDTVVHIATQYGAKKRYDVSRLKLLIKAGADINVHNIQGQTSLQIAFLMRRKNAFKTLLAARCDTRGTLEMLVNVEEKEMEKKLIKAKQSEIKRRKNNFKRYTTQKTIEIMEETASKEIEVIPARSKEFWYIPCVTYVEYFEDLMRYGADFESDTKSQYMQKFEKFEEWQKYRKIYQNADEYLPVFNDYQKVDEYLPDIKKWTNEYLIKDTLNVDENDDESFNRLSYLIKDWRPKKTERDTDTMLIPIRPKKEDKKIQEILDVYLAMFDNDDESEFVKLYFNDIIMSYVWDEKWLILNNICSASQYEPILLNCFHHKDFKDCISRVICKTGSDSINLMVEALTFAYGVSYIQSKNKQRENNEEIKGIQECVEYIMKQTIYHKLNLNLNDWNDTKENVAAHMHHVELNENKETEQRYLTETETNTEEDNKVNQQQTHRHKRDMNYFMDLYEIGLRKDIISKQMTIDAWSEDEIELFLSALQEKMRSNDLENDKQETDEEEMKEYKEETLFVGNLHRDMTPLNSQTPMTQSLRDAKHEWVMFITTSLEKLEEPQSINKVIYSLHKSYKESEITVKKSPFYLRKVGWGAFEISVEIRFRDKNKESLFLLHMLNFDVPVVITDIHNNEHFPKNHEVFLTKNMQQKMIRDAKRQTSTSPRAKKSKK